jgi:hypothetical protein
MNAAFQKRRADGRSYREVVVEHVAGFQPGQVFTYESLAKLLSEGTDREFTRDDVQNIVQRSRAKLLREQQRTLVSRANVGYVLSRANEHLGIADDQTKRGQRRLKHAVLVLENARLDEMTTTEREIHIAQCEINRTIYREHRRILTKQARHGELIARLTSRVEQLEGKAE